MLFLGGTDVHRPPLPSRAPLDSLSLVAQKCSVILWISQLFPGCFRQRLGAVLASDDLVMVPGAK